MITISIIIPVYNSAPWLERCVESVEDQDLEAEDYEVILVNDGSTDDSLHVAQELSRKYSNIKIIDKKNGGMSSARNAGIELARGKYFMFVDSDDYIEPNCLRELIKVCEDNNLDLCQFPLTLKYPDGRTIKSYFSEKEINLIYTGKDLLKSIGAIGSACSIIYKSNVLTQYQLRFYEGITHEDAEFTTRLFCHVNRAMKINYTVYYYVIHTDSVSHSKSYQSMDKNLCDSAIVAALGKIYAKDQVKDKETADLICRIENNGLGGTMINLLRMHDYPKSIVKHFIATAQVNHVYPLRGSFLNRKMKMASYLLNCKSLFLSLYNFRRGKKD